MMPSTLWCSLLLIGQGKFLTALPLQKQAVLFLTPALSWNYQLHNFPLETFLRSWALPEVDDGPGIF